MIRLMKMIIRRHFPTACVTLFVCFLLHACSTRMTTNTSKTTKGAIISEQQAVQIATEAVKNVSYDRDIGVSVQHEPGRYIVTFPIKKPALKPGEYYRGASYAARVVVDEKTGKIIQVKVGS